MDVIRAYAVHYEREGVQHRIVGKMIPRGSKRVGLRWWMERRNADGSWEASPVSVFNLPPRDDLIRLLTVVRRDAELMGYKVGRGTLLPYIIAEYTL